MTPSTVYHCTAPTAPPYPSLADLLAELPTAERKRLRQTWRFTRQTLDVANLVLRQPRPGLETVEQFEDLVAFAIWRLRLIRRTVRRARMAGSEMVVAS